MRLSQRHTPVTAYICSVAMLLFDLQVPSATVQVLSRGGGGGHGQSLLEPRHSFRDDAW